MTVGIKLTEDDIELDEAGVVPNGLQVKIYIDHQTGFEKAKQLKQQILDDSQNIQRVNDLMAELEIENLELFCANAITWKKKAEKLPRVEDSLL